MTWLPFSQLNSRPFHSHHSTKSRILPQDRKIFFKSHGMFLKKTKTPKFPSTVANDTCPTRSRTAQPISITLTSPTTMYRTQRFPQQQPPIARLTPPNDPVNQPQPAAVALLRGSLRSIDRSIDHPMSIRVLLPDRSLSLSFA